MANWALKLLIEQLIKAVIKAVSDWLAFQKVKKKVVVKAKEIMSDPDRENAARRMRDLLNS